MTFTDRFFGRGNPRAGQGPVANPRLQDPPSLQVLFSSPIRIDEGELTDHLRTLHRDMANATAELFKVDPTPPGVSEKAPDGAPGAVMGLIAWGPHVIKLVGVPRPMPPEPTENSIGPAHYEQIIKDAAYGHVAHILLFYAGYHPDPHEQYVVLTAASAAVSRFGAVVVANEFAHTSIPAFALSPQPRPGDYLEWLRTLPIPYLYAGFVKMEVQGVPGVWMRTCGCPVLRLPDLAFHASGHYQGRDSFALFSNVLAYLRESAASFAPGHTLQLGKAGYFRLREPHPHEAFLDSEGQMFVVESVTADEVNG